MFGVRQLESLAILLDDELGCFDTIQYTSVTDGQTDRQQHSIHRVMRMRRAVKMRWGNGQER